MRTMGCKGAEMYDVFATGVRAGGGGVGNAVFFRGIAGTVTRRVVRRVVF
jgi:hypothetical protein